jgi:glycosidase
MPADLASDHRAYGVTGDLYPRDLRYDPADAAHCARVDAGVFFRVNAEDAFVEGMLVRRNGDRVRGYELRRRRGVGRFASWEVVVDDDGEPFDYSFAFRTAKGAACYLAPSGITNAIERLDRWVLDPGALPAHDVPRWARGAVFYQIFPDRFADGDPSLTPPGAQAWGEEPHPLRFQGGDLRGVAARVGYLEDLGIDAVYLNPIFTSPSNHRYDTIDYYSVDPALGGNAALRELVTVLHERGIRIILDASFNHCHPRFGAFADVVEKGPSSRYAGWFDVWEHPVRVEYRPNAKVAGRHPDWGKARAATLADETGVEVVVADDDGPIFRPRYDAWYGVPTMPRVNLRNPEARRYMLDVAAHWVREYGIDGWRMDVARYVDVDFWDDFRAEVKAVNPDCYLVAEVMGDAGTWLQGNRFDATMNYTFRDLCIDFFARASLDTAAFLDGYCRMRSMYSPAVDAVNFNLLSSHDTPRVSTEADGDGRRVLLATLFQLTVPGAPSVYYGDELAMEGGHDPAGRGAFPVDVPADGAQMHAAVRALVHLRKSTPALRDGAWELTGHRGETFSYRRIKEGHMVSVAFNLGPEPASVPLGPSGSPTLLWGSGRVAVDGGEARLDDLAPMSGAVVAL